MHNKKKSAISMDDSFSRRNSVGDARQLLPNPSSQRDATVNAKGSFTFL